VRWRIEVGYREGIFDALGHLTVQDIRDLGITGVSEVRTGGIYWIEGDLSEDEVHRICRELLADPITQEYEFYPADSPPSLPPDAWVVEVRYRPGVTDAVGDSVVKGVRDMGIDSIRRARTGRKYIIRGNLSKDEIETICRRLLYNDVIETYDLFGG